jgi:hypothetical protein
MQRVDGTLRQGARGAWTSCSAVIEWFYCQINAVVSFYSISTEEVVTGCAHEVPEDSKQPPWSPQLTNEHPDTSCDSINDSQQSIDHVRVSHIFTLFFQNHPVLLIRGVLCMVK